MLRRRRTSRPAPCDSFGTYAAPLRNSVRSTALSQAQTRLNTLTTENAVMSAQLSSSTADVARLTTSNDKWQQMCDGRARG